jgi:hypothetical protein
LVLNLHRAAMENRKEQLKADAMGFSVAVMNALDAALGGGKGKILENWLKAMDAPKDDQAGDRPRRGSVLTPGAKAFFGGAPVVIKRD